MNNFEQVLKSMSIACQQVLSTKQDVLVVLSALLTNNTMIDAEEVCAIFNHETQTSVNLGHGVTLPHIHYPGLAQAKAAFIQLQRGIHFDNQEDAPVDLIIALMVPSEPAELHLDLLRQFATRLHLAQCRQDLRLATTAEQIRHSLGLRDA
jgi:nitrogen PTS system EIIA component